MLTSIDNEDWDPAYGKKKMQLSWRCHATSTTASQAL